jgi:predicted nucleic acid-binding protein
MVLDASVTLAWCFGDEHSDYAAGILERVAGASAFAPAIWPLEIANALLVGERRGRLTEADSGHAISLLTDLPIRVDQASSNDAFTRIVPIARAHRLSSYDAAYLELCVRLSLPLATIDSRLIDAAEGLGVSVVS